MRASHFRRIRKKMQDYNWLYNKYLDKLNQSESCNHFRDFDCDSAFRGHHLAKHNTEIHRKWDKKLTAKIKWLKTRLDALKPVI